MFLRDTNFPSVALFFLFTGFSHDGIGFCFGVSRRDRFFLGRAFVPVVFLTTESVFVLGFHDGMPFCFGGSRRDAVLFWGFTTSDESNDESNDER